MAEIDADSELIDLVRRGGVYYNMTGDTPAEALADAVSTVPVPPGVDRAALLTALVEREGLMPTGVGFGIALPHPRTPIVSDPAQAFVSVCFLRQPIDWKALDGKPVGTLLLIASASTKQHLRTLSRISFLCRQSAFRKLLQARASREELISAIADAEKTWND